VERCFLREDVFLPKMISCETSFPGNDVIFVKNVFFRKMFLQKTFSNRRRFLTEDVFLQKMFSYNNTVASIGLPQSTLTNVILYDQ